MINIELKREVSILHFALELVLLYYINISILIENINTDPSLEQYLTIPYY